MATLFCVVSSGFFWRSFCINFFKTFSTLITCFTCFSWTFLLTKNKNRTTRTKQLLWKVWVASHVVLCLKSFSSTTLTLKLKRVLLTNSSLWHSPLLLLGPNQFYLSKPYILFPFSFSFYAEAHYLRASFSWTSSFTPFFFLGSPRFNPN